MDIPLTSDFAIAVGRVRTIVLVRWFGVVFALVQVLSYQTMPYPPGIREAALGIVAVLAVSNGVFEVAKRRATEHADVRRLALAILATDVLGLSGLTWVYAFDNLSALFAILFLVPIEGAVLFGFPGAMWTWGAVAALYVGREFFGTRYGHPFELESVTFRLGLIGLVALIVGLLVRDLVNQRQATAVALDDAQRSEESRSRLISMLAHDVRAPLAAARQAFDTLAAAGDRIDHAKRLELLVAGRRQADRALLLARDLLDLARVEAGTLTVDLEAVDLQQLVRRVQEVIGNRAELRQDLQGLQVHADPARMEQVLFNLVDNAVKYGAEPIEITARRTGDTVELSIRDHGPGIPDGVELFTAFSHAGEGSVGLGMWIVRHLVEANQGTVAHHPTDSGACFVVRLPAVDGGQASMAASSSVSETTSPVSRS